MMPVSQNAQPSVDVVIPAYNEEASISRCLDATLGQVYPRDRFRVLLVDAGSTDRTLEIASECAGREPRLVVLPAGRRLTTPEALNFGIQHSSADVVARVDAHGWPEPDFLRLATAALEDGGPDVAAVGGRPLAADDTRFGRAFALARGSRFGVGGSVYAAPGKPVETDTVPWGIYRRTELVDAGGFDPAMNYGEDEELNWRIRRRGRRILFDPRVRFRYVPRSSPSGVYRQYRNYGEARVRVVAKHPDFLRPHHLAPAALVASAAGLAAASLTSSTARRALVALAGTYSLATSTAAVVAARSSEPRLIPEMAACFAALHIGYGLGMLQGFAKLATDRRRTPDVPLSS